MTEKQFFSYVYDFYGPGGVYDMGVTMQDIIAAYELMQELPHYDFEFDSVDREHLRDVLIEDFGYKFPDVS